jgi:hypothetical protein
MPCISVLAGMAAVFCSEKRRPRQKEQQQGIHETDMGNQNAGKQTYQQTRK